MVAVLEPQNAAGAVTWLPCVTGGEAGEGDVAARLEGQDVGVAGDGGDGVSRYAAVIAADGQIVHPVNDQLGAVKFVQPVVIIALGGAVAGGGAEVVQFPVQHDVHVGADGGDQLIHRGNVDFQLRLSRLRRACGVQLVHLLIGKRIACAVRDGTAVSKPAADAAIFKPVAVQNHTRLVCRRLGIFVVLILEVECFQLAAVVGEQIALHLNGASGNDCQIHKAAVADFAVFHRHIPAGTNIKIGVSAVFLGADAVNAGSGDGDVVTADDLGGAAGAVVHVAVRERNVLGICRLQADHAAAVDAQTVHAHAGAVLQVDDAAAAFAQFQGVTGGEILQRDIFAILQIDDAGRPGVAFQSRVHLAAAADGQVLYVLQHQLKAVVLFRPCVVGAFRGQAVAFGAGQIVGSRLQLDDGVRRDGGQQFVHIADGDGIRGSGWLGIPGGCRIFSRGAGHQAHRHEDDGDHAHQTDPEAGLLIGKHRLDALLDAHLAEGHGTGREVRPIGGAVQQGGGVGFPLVQLHELHHPLVAGDLDVLAQQDIGCPHQRIEPVQCQRQKAHHLEPVVALVQMGAFVGENVTLFLGSHAHGDVDIRADEAQNKSGLDAVAFPAAGDPDGLPNLQLQGQVGVQTVNAEAAGNAKPEPWQNRQEIKACIRFRCGFRGVGGGAADHGGNGSLNVRKRFGRLHRRRDVQIGRGKIFRRGGCLGVADLLLHLCHRVGAGLQAQVALDLEGHQQPQSRQQPEQADILSGCFLQHQPQQHNGQNDDAAVEAGRQDVLEQCVHVRSSS